MAYCGRRDPQIVIGDGASSRVRLCFQIPICFTQSKIIGQNNDTAESCVQIEDLPSTPFPFSSSE